MRIRTIFFKRNGNDFEEKGILLETLTCEYIVDAVGQMVYMCEIEDYRIVLNFVATIDMSKF